MLLRSVCLVLALLLVSFGGRLLAADRDAELAAILEKATAGNAAIKNFSCTTRCFVPVDDPEHSWREVAAHAEETPREGFFLLTTFKVVVDRVGARKRFEGKEYWSTSQDHVPQYRASVYAYDGHVYRTFLPGDNWGRRMVTWRRNLVRDSLHSLLGDDLQAAVTPDVNLVDLLRQPEGWQLESAPDEPQRRITRHYRQRLAGTELELHVGLSPKHDYLPAFFRTVWCDIGTMCEQYRVEQFAQVGPEKIWVPVRARHQHFYREAIFPPGITSEGYQKLTPEQKREIDPQITFRARSLGAPELIEIDPESIKINEPLADKTFDVEFPATAKIEDDVEQQPVAAG